MKKNLKQAKKIIEQYEECMKKQHIFIIGMHYIYIKRCVTCTGEGSKDDN